MSKIKAINDYLIVKSEKKPVSSIITIKTGEYDEKQEFLKSKLIALSIGDKVTKVKEGDRVIIGNNKPLRYEKFATLIGEEESDLVEYFICHEEDIAGVLN